MSQPAYNIRAIRKLLSAVFKRGEDLYLFCTDFSEFTPVTEQFSGGMGKDQMIQRLIEYSDRKVLMARLLEVIKAEDPAQYAQFESEIFGGKKAESISSSNPTAVPAETEFLRKLISEKTRYLQTLQLQAAKFGISAPPHIVLEIEDLEKEIAELRQKLNT
ncbi:MAG: hypothetical protein KJ077_41580 [Anaerolineae bacterium]|nr:hypothetical protein [Anaerolineae bacterium]